MKITIENYEAYLLDEMEGNLSSEDLQELNIFLNQHPEIAIDFDIDSTQLSVEDFITYPDKKRLYFDHINESNYLHFFTAYWENELTENEKLSVLSWLEIKPKYHTVFKRFEKCILKPDYNIIYPNKEQLYQSISIAKKGYWRIALVASFVGFILMLFNLTTNEISSNAKYVKAFEELKKTKTTRTSAIQEISEVPSYVANKDMKIKNHKEIAKVSAEKLNSDSQNTSNNKHQLNILETPTKEFNDEKNPVESTLSAIDISMPSMENTLSYKDLSFYRENEFALNEPIKSNNLISSIFNKGVALIRRKPNFDNLPQLPDLKSFRQVFESNEELASENTDIRIIRFRLLGITVEHKKVIEEVIEESK